MTNALKSAFFVLNNKGKPRGYLPPAMQNQDNSEKLTPAQIVQAVKDGLASQE
jgi:hypothetical protein